MDCFYFQSLPFKMLITFERLLKLFMFLLLEFTLGFSVNDVLVSSQIYIIITVLSLHLQTVLYSFL